MILNSTFVSTNAKAFRFFQNTPTFQTFKYHRFPTYHTVFPIIVRVPIPYYHFNHNKAHTLYKLHLTHVTITRFSNLTKSISILTKSIARPIPRKNRDVANYARLASQVLGINSSQLKSSVEGTTEVVNACSLSTRYQRRRLHSRSSDSFAFTRRNSFTRWDLRRPRLARPSKWTWRLTFPRCLHLAVFFEKLSSLDGTSGIEHFRLVFGCCNIPDLMSRYSLCIRVFKTVL